jgi:hypothetical protein
MVANGSKWHKEGKADPTCPRSNPLQKLIDGLS